MLFTISIIFWVQMILQKRNVNLIWSRIKIYMTGIIINKLVFIKQLKNSLTQSNITEISIREIGFVFLLKISKAIQSIMIDAPYIKWNIAELQYLELKHILTIFFSSTSTCWNTAAAKVYFRVKISDKVNKLHQPNRRIKRKNFTAFCLLCQWSVKQYQIAIMAREWLYWQHWSELDSK